MRSKLAEMTGIDSARLYIGEVYQSRVYKVLSDTVGLRSILARDIIFAYELDEDTNPVQVLNRKPSRSTYGGPDKFSYPLVIGLPAGCTNRDVRTKMQVSLSPSLPPSLPCPPSLPPPYSCTL